MTIKSFFVFLVILAGGMVVHGPAVHARQAEGYRIKNAVTVKANVSGSKLRLSHKVTVTNRNDAALQTLDFALPVSETNALKVKHADGSKIPFTKSVTNSRVAGQPVTHAKLALEFPRNITGAGKTWHFTVSYTTSGGIDTAGGNTTVTLPLLDGNVADAWNAVLDVPGSLPDINYHPRVSRMFRADGRQRFVFDSDSLKRNILGVSFTGTRMHTVDMEAKIRNSSLLRKTVSLTLPPDMHNQSVFVHDIEPQPDVMRVDRDGNIIAEYELWPWEEKTVTATAAVRAKQLRYDPAGAKPVSKTPEHLRSHTKPAGYWPIEGVVRERADKIADNNANAWKKARQLHDFVQKNIAVEKESTDRRSAEYVLENRSGDPRNIADTLVALLRSQDIPARLVEGVIYPGAGLNKEQHTHAWVEAYIAGVGWVTLDPLWSEVFGSFGYSSSDRVAMRLHSEGDQFQSVYPLSAGGFRIKPGGKLPEPEPDRITGKATRYILVPGIVYDKRTIMSRSGYITDNVKADEVFNGALAPRTRLSAGTWSIAMPSSFQMTWKVDDQDPDAVDASLQWWPITGPVLIVVIGGVIQFYRYRSKRYMRERLGDDMYH